MERVNGLKLRVSRDPFTDSPHPPCNQLSSRAVARLIGKPPHEILDVEGSLRITGTADLHVEAQRALEAACARPVTTP